MQPITTLTSRVVVRPGREHRHRPDHPGALSQDHQQGGLGKHLFTDWRYDADGAATARLPA